LPAASILVAAIMPQRLRSGKEQAGRDSHASFNIFRKME
jgi:hypothetical protein